MDEILNSATDNTTVNQFPRSPYKLPTVLITATLMGFVMRASGYGINDSVVAILGLTVSMWFGLIYIESFRRNRIRRAIFKKYPNGIIWKDQLFSRDISIGKKDFDNEEIEAVAVDATSDTGFHSHKFSDLDIEFVLRVPLDVSTAGQYP